MGLTTEIIRYNLNDRKRKYVGQDRKFNIEKLAKLINGYTVQEMVKKRDLVGYLGHDVRLQFGMRPPEMALNGKEFVPIEPAFITTYVKCFDDGTVEHQAQFLDTPLGIKAQEWHSANLGGFSSVITPSEQNPTSFYGFDYVLSPNFHGNRGYAVMDSVAYEKELNRLTSKQKYHEIQARQMEQQAVMDALFQATQSIPQMTKQHQQLIATINSLSEQLENVQRERDEFQAICDNLQPEFEPVARLSVHENWLQQSLSVLDDIRGNTEIYPQNQNQDFAFKATLEYLKNRK